MRRVHGAGTSSREAATAALLGGDSPFAGGRWRIPGRFNFTGDVVERLAADRNRRALVFVDAVQGVRSFGFADVAAAARRWAGLVRAAGVGRGDRVLVVTGKTLDWHPLMLALLKIGAVAVPCPDMLRGRDLAYRASDSGARLVVADERTQAEVRLMEDLLEQPPRVLFLDEARARLEREPGSAETERTSSSDLAFILYTSGMGRHPKGVAHTHGYCFATRLQARCWLAARTSDLVWCTASTGWAKAIWNALLGPWSLGAPIVLHEGRFDPGERFALVARLGVTVLCQTPTEYRMMAKTGGREPVDLSRVRHAVSAGEPLNAEVIRVFEEAFDLTIRDGYGQTENTLLVGNSPGMAVRPGSMGLPAPGHEVAVVDADGRELPAGEEGDIVLRGRPPTLFAGYWRKPEETARVFRGEWYVTGDRATRDEDGYFWFTGRADDVILSSAYRIGPFEVESALLEHEAVSESAVVGKPDPDRGQLVKAFVVLRAGREPTPALGRELQQHVARVTAPYKYPREIEFVAELPKDGNGKLRRSELRRLEERRARRES